MALPNDPAAPRLLRKLLRQFDLPAGERTALVRLLSMSMRTLRHRACVVEDGAPPNEISVVLEGWACRSITTGDKRRIVGFYLPGDVCDADALVMDGIDGQVSAIGAARVAGIGSSHIEFVARQCPELTSALQWEALGTATIQRRWTVNMTERNAGRRLAHLLCELFVRLDAVDLVDDDGRCAWPVSQTELGDALGMASEHVNRTLRTFREIGLLSIIDHRLEMGDFDRLADIGGFSPAYLLVTNAAPRRRWPRIGSTRRV